MPNLLSQYSTLPIAEGMRGFISLFRVLVRKRMQQFELAHCNIAIQYVSNYIMETTTAVHKNSHL